MRSVLLLVAFLSCVAFCRITIPPSTLGTAPYPEWAHYHWVWLSSSQSNQSAVIDFVNGFLAYDIPVGAVDIDSQWAISDNDFVWNTEIYPDPQQMIDYFHSLNIRVICWVTSMVNNDSPTYNEGVENNYFLNGGKLITWWHGQGAFIDYTNPYALDWWHQQMDNVISMGIDGWKCDGTDPYVFELIVPRGYAGIISEREYANDYYSDFFFYTRSINPEALIMSRPVDDLWSFSPRDVVFSGWVGDNDPTFEGMQFAIWNMFHSAWANYVNFGSDIGGYRYGEGPLGRTKQLFIRWAQLGAFCPLMENGGNQEHRPWKFDDTNQTVDIYRTFVAIHLELVPYLLSAGTEAYEQGISVMMPQSEYTVLFPVLWGYNLWYDIFVTPVTENVTSVNVRFPGSPGVNSSNWVDWWNSSVVYAAGSNVDNYDTPLELFPVFQRQGSILPLNVTTALGGNGDPGSADALTLLITHPVPGQCEKKAVYAWKGLAQEFEYYFDEAERNFYFNATAHPFRSVILLLRGVVPAQYETGGGSPVILDLVADRELPRMPSKKQLDATGVGWYHRPASQSPKSVDELFVRPGDGTQGVSIVVHNLEVTPYTLVK